MGSVRVRVRVLPRLLPPSHLNITADAAASSQSQVSEREKDDIIGKLGPTAAGFWVHVTACSEIPRLRMDLRPEVSHKSEDRKKNKEFFLFPVYQILVY